MIDELYVFCFQTLSVQDNFLLNILPKSIIKKIILYLLNIFKFFSYLSLTFSKAVHWKNLYNYMQLIS